MGLTTPTPVMTTSRLPLMHSTLNQSLPSW